jgi:addiction module RelB/DinJ family antitoxin
MKTVLNIKADKEVKEKAKKVAAELGLPLSTVINAYLKQFIRNKEIYFSVAPRMTPGLEKLIGQAEKDLAAGRNLSPKLRTAADIDRYLGS